MDFPKAISDLIAELKLLPAIGPKSAERIAIWLLTNQRRNPIALAEALVGCEKTISFCPTCGFFCEVDAQCKICSSTTRHQNMICIVESAPDVISLENSEAFQGLYHCLGGVLSPLDNIHPENLNLGKLRERVHQLEGKGGELILAISATVEGEATCHYIESLFAESTVKVTRLARGLPMGANLEYADHLTLSRAFAGRKGAS